MELKKELNFFLKNDIMVYSHKVEDSKAQGYCWVDFYLPCHRFSTLQRINNAFQPKEMIIGGIPHTVSLLCNKNHIFEGI